jgi:RNA polymerase sigma-54 factor
MVDNEDPNKPMSDEKISQILTTEGFPVARRTVAKYREQLNIPVARLRKKI